MSNGLREYCISIHLPPLDIYSNHCCLVSDTAQKHKAVFRLIERVLMWIFLCSNFFACCTLAHRKHETGVKFSLIFTDWCSLLSNLNKRKAISWNHSLEQGQESQRQNWNDTNGRKRNENLKTQFVQNSCFVQCGQTSEHQMKEHSSFIEWRIPLGTVAIIPINRLLMNREKVDFDGILHCFWLGLKCGNKVSTKEEEKCRICPPSRSNG